MYRLPLEIKQHILGYCNIQDIAILAQASAVLNGLARDFVQHRLRLLTKPFFENTETLLGILRTCDAVMSGSCALHVLLPANETCWIPSDLDIYVSCRHMACLSVAHLVDTGYVVVCQRTVDAGPYGLSSIHLVVSFANDRQSIDVIVSSTVAAVSPIFEFHSTTMMNFISADHIFCAYPALTLHLMSLVNAGPIYFEPFGFRTMCALEKYGACGFVLEACQDVHGVSRLCRLMPRSIADHHCLWVNMNMLGSVSMSPAKVFDCLGFINLIWLLGGYLCGDVYPFIRSQCFLIEDDSHELLGPQFLGSQESA
ncbi:hypothetical protein BKA82DRAFT_4380443 [Pisolithus tinctorius]|nr:hypothetical protein BKA82DRAFT_4380443 [Pisolithus tinctorius]